MDDGTPNVGDILRRCSDLPPTERFAALGDFLFGAREMLDLLWTHSSTQFESPDALLRALRVLRAEPFAPCFHTINRTHVFLPFGRHGDGPLIFLDMCACPRDTLAIFSLIAPLLCTREYSPSMRDSLVVPAGVDPAVWETHRAPLERHFATRACECSSDADAVMSMLQIK
jgi:hypothetical protein